MGDYQIWFDEASKLTPRMLRRLEQHNRKQRAAGFGWFNWYVNRYRLPLHPTNKELRAVSWRRVK